MKEGKIVESGKVKDIFDNPQHSYTVKLLNSIPGKKVELNLENEQLLTGKKVDIKISNSQEYIWQNS